MKQISFYDPFGRNGNGIDIDLEECVIQYDDNYPKYVSKEDLPKIQEVINHNIESLRSSIERTIKRLNQREEIKTVIDNGVKISKPLTESGRKKKKSELKNLREELNFLKSFNVNNLDLHNKVYEFNTKYEEGFIDDEIKSLISEYPHMNEDKFWSAMTGNTCIMRNGKFVNYHCDILTALRCGVQHRDMHTFEWD